MSPPRLIQPHRDDCRRRLAAVLLVDLAQSRAAEARFAARIAALQKREARLVAERAREARLATRHSPLAAPSAGAAR